MRKKMPNRRPTATWNIEFEQQKLTGTIGYDPETGIPREAFFSTRAKAGTLLDGLLYDAGVLLSLALQYGTPATALAKSVARLEDGSTASHVGELIDVCPIHIGIFLVFYTLPKLKIESALVYC